MKHLKPIKPLLLRTRYLYITIGIALLALGYYYFVIPADLVAGGVTGLATVFNKWFSIRVSYIVLIVNVLLLILSLIFLGKKATIRTVYGSILFPVFLFLYETFVPIIDTKGDLVLASAFGGGLIGLGFGLVIRYGGTSGGTDIVIKIFKKYFNLAISKGIYWTDGFVVGLGVIAFYQEHGITTGLYALITIYISGRVADRVIVGNNEKKAVHIITNQPSEIKEQIYRLIERGVTEVQIRGGYSKNEKTMLVSVITKREYYLVRNIVAGIDEAAFVYVMPATEIQGEFIEKESDEE